MLTLAMLTSFQTGRYGASPAAECPPGCGRPCRDDENTHDCHSRFQVNSRPSSTLPDVSLKPMALDDAMQQAAFEEGLGDQAAATLGKLPFFLQHSPCSSLPL